VEIWKSVFCLAALSNRREGNIAPVPLGSPNSKENLSFLWNVHYLISPLYCNAFPVPSACFGSSPGYQQGNLLLVYNEENTDQNCITIAEFLGFSSGRAQNSVLLAYDTVSVCNWIPTLWDIVASPSKIEMRMRWTGCVSGMAGTYVQNANTETRWKETTQKT